MPRIFYFSTPPNGLLVPFKFSSYLRIGALIEFAVCILPTRNHKVQNCWCLLLLTKHFLNGMLVHCSCSKWRFLWFQSIPSVEPEFRLIWAPCMRCLLCACTLGFLAAFFLYTLNGVPHFWATLLLGPFRAHTFYMAFSVFETPLAPLILRSSLTGLFLSLGFCLGTLSPLELWTHTVTAVVFQGREGREQGLSPRRFLCVSLLATFWGWLFFFFLWLPLIFLEVAVFSLFCSSSSTNFEIAAFFWMPIFSRASLCCLSVALLTCFFGPRTRVRLLTELFVSSFSPSLPTFLCTLPFPAPDPNPLASFNPQP